MDYIEKLKVWKLRRSYALSLITGGMARKDVAKKLRITRQRLSAIERYARAEN